MLLLSAQLALAQCYEYWIDGDYDKRTVVAGAASDLSLSVDLSQIKPGVHYFNFRNQIESGQWGGMVRYLFYIPTEMGKDADNTVVLHEYWLDNHYDSRTVVQGSVGSGPLAIDISKVSPGVHYFNFRSQGRSGQWGGMVRYLFYISDHVDIKMQDVASVRYWLDEDFANVQTQQMTDSTIVITMDITDVPKGSHQFNVYGLSSTGRCSLFDMFTFTTNPLPQVPKPLITHDGNTVQIADGPDPDATYPIEYHYTLDGTAPTRNGTLYEGPFEVVRNGRIRAIGIQYAHDPSEVAELEVDWFKVDAPVVVQNGKTLTMACTTPEATLYYKMGTGEEQTYTTPLRLADQTVLTVVARRDGYHDSPTLTYQPRVVKSAKPAVVYDGRYLQLTSNEEGVSLYYTQDGTSPTDGLDVASTARLYTGKMTLDSLCTLRAVAVIDSMNVSDVQEYAVNYLYDGQTAYLRQAGMLERAFEWAGGIQGIEQMQVVGVLNNTDLSTLKNVPTLTHLDLSEATLSSGQLPSDAFTGSQLLSFVSPRELRDAGGRLFADCPRLAAVVWKAGVRLLSNTFEGVNNPNLLLYVDAADLNQTSVANVVVNGTAKEISLSDATTGNNNFHCPEAFMAESISYKHDYQQETVIGQVRGWETLTLPFTVQTITHETNGTLLPFDADGDGKPFWLMELQSGGLTNATKIEANRPYVISMPNNPSVYADAYNQKGRVTFAATNVTVPATVLESATGVGLDGLRRTLLPTMQSVARSASVCALNVGEAIDGHPEGSVFRSDYRDVRPFEVYLLESVGSRQVIPLRSLMNGQTTGIQTLESDAGVADGTGDAIDSWYSIDGRKLQGRPAKKGLYINRGQKVVVK